MADQKKDLLKMINQPKEIIKPKRSMTDIFKSASILNFLFKKKGVGDGKCRANYNNQKAQSVKRSGKKRIKDKIADASRKYQRRRAKKFSKLI